VEKYNLDDKGGLFKFLAKSPQKVIKSGDGIELIHFSLFNHIKARVSEVSETSIRITSTDKTSDFVFNTEDHVVLYYNSGDFYVVTGIIGTLNKSDPLDMVIKVSKIEKLKDLIKEKRHCISLHATFKIIGVPEVKPAIVKNISFGGIKTDCFEDIMLEDIVEVTIYVDKANKLMYRGRIVKKNKIGSLFEYGIEYTDMTESSNKLLTRVMYDIDSLI
jgi:hypothetical protein